MQLVMTNHFLQSSTSDARRPMRSYQVVSILQMAIAMRWRCLSGFWKVSRTEYQSTVYQSMSMTRDVGWLKL